MSDHFWEAICTILFVVIFFRPIKKYILGLTDNYRDRITKEVDSVDSLKNNAEKNLKHYKELHKHFMEKSNLVIQASKENLKKISEDSKERLNHQIKVQKELHKERIHIYQQETLHELRKKALSKALLVSQHYLEDKHSNISPGQVEESLNLVKQNKNLYN